ncbi:hypothetical protein BDV33DRAFT_117146 [Aspergillus novoparasiticus]|uniref:Uncharacterized protein n=1 Tax=Aspergillus novoparasiticus TaxID=986946 RepID=A0A5N6EQD0_9EURO|nr:hypothetical protein BDV33DRAFT_117146 [Aspergillus novoparasiticus]
MKRGTIYGVDHSDSCKSPKKPFPRASFPLDRLCSVSSSVLLLPAIVLPFHHAFASLLGLVVV